MPTYPSSATSGRARVEAHPYRDRAGAEALLRLARPRPRAGIASGKATKKASPCVSTSTPPWPLERGPEHAPVLRERAGIPLRPELVQKQRGAFDVGEKERHRAPRELGHRP